jgi:outer membrane protein assembly factor BamB
MRILTLSLVIGTLACFGCNNQNGLVAPDFEAGELPVVGRPLPRRAGGHGGWKVAVANGQPLTTPAVVDGRVFVGAGLGSHEFSAYDAASGALLWHYHPADNGPTTAVADDGYVVFSTESCELEVIDYDGHAVWKKWLGDPLLSAPAVSNGRVYTAYPGGSGNYSLACYDLKSGDELWAQAIPAEVITAPVVHDQFVLAATLDGTLSCFESSTGQALWSEQAGATSSPVVAGSVCYFSRLIETEGSQTDAHGIRRAERIAWRALELCAPVRDLAGLERDLTQLRLDDVPDRSVFENVLIALSHSASDAPNHTTLSEANLTEVWTYQGSRPFLDEQNLYAALGGKVVCVALETQAVRWEKDLVPPAQGNIANTGLFMRDLSPPALVNGKIFLGTRDGRVVCLSAATGDVLWTEEIGEPIVCQPAVVGGRVYAGTNSGSLVAVESGDPQDAGWAMWGANSQHTGQARPARR